MNKPCCHNWKLRLGSHFYGGLIERPSVITYFRNLYFQLCHNLQKEAEVCDFSTGKDFSTFPHLSNGDFLLHSD